MLNTMPYSEVCMHMGIAGKRMAVTFHGPGMVQVREEDGRPVGAPITLGEAGFRRDENGVAHSLTENAEDEHEREIAAREIAAAEASERP